MRLTPEVSQKGCIIPPSLNRDFQQRGSDFQNKPHKKNEVVADNLKVQHHIRIRSAIGGIDLEFTGEKPEPRILPRSLQGVRGKEKGPNLIFQSKTNEN